MSLSIEDSRFVSELRLKMVQNMKAGLPSQAGIDKEVLKRAIELVRKDRSIGAASSSKSKANTPVIEFDVNSWLKK